MISTQVAKMVLDNEIRRMTTLRDGLTDNGRDLHPEEQRMLTQVTVQHMRDLMDELAMDVFMRRPMDFNADYFNDLLGIVHEVNDRG